MSGMTLHMGENQDGRSIKVPAGILIALISLTIGGGGATTVSNFFRNDTAVYQQLVQLNATTAEMGRTIAQLVIDMRDMNAKVNASREEIIRLQERNKRVDSIEHKEKP